MTLFEYLAIAFSLVLSFSGVRLVQGLPHAVKRGRRYWIHLCFVAWQLIVTITAFWIVWSYREVAWTLPSFALVLMSLGVIYHNACALVPEAPSSVDSWRDHFNAYRRRYFCGVVIWIMTAAATSTVVLDMALFHPARAGHVAVAIAGIVGASTAEPRVHGVVGIVLLILSVIMAIGVGFEPGTFAR